jgi:hypothetical protein
MALPSCEGENTDECFTSTEKSVLAKWYQGPRNSAGEQLFPGTPPGGERFLGYWFLDTDDRIKIGNQLGGGYAKYLGFPEGTHDAYTALEFDFDRDPQRLAVTGKLLRKVSDVAWLGGPSRAARPESSLLRKCCQAHGRR